MWKIFIHTDIRNRITEEVMKSLVNLSNWEILAQSIPDMYEKYSIVNY